MIDLRLRSRISDSELNQKVGKIITDQDYNVVLTGPARVRKPDGSLLCVYLPGALSPLLAEEPVIYNLLHSLRIYQTDNRGEASGSVRFKAEGDNRSRSKKVRSTIIGSFDPGGPKQFCRLTSWNAQNLERFALLVPFFREIGAYFLKYAPDRYAAQMEWVNQTDPAWVIKGTPFTTVTVNNTYPTGVHQDKGDLETGFSTLAVLRRGDYTGGRLCFARYRVAVDMKDGDLMLMDAHEHHGNTRLEAHDDLAERISVVSYYRTGMASCGSADDEYAKAIKYAEGRGHGHRADDAASEGQADDAGVRTVAAP